MHRPLNYHLPTDLDQTAGTPMEKLGAHRQEIARFLELQRPLREERQRAVEQMVKMRHGAAQ